MSRPVDFSNVVEEINAELLDPRFADLLHGRAAGASSGCRGPLCRKYRRDRDRRWRARRYGGGAHGAHGGEDEEFLKQVIASHVKKMMIERAETYATEIAS